MSALLPDPARLEAIVIGGSAGALAALGPIVAALPRDLPIPVIVVLHLKPDDPSGLPAVVAARCALPVREADDKEPIAPGTLYLAPPAYHLLVERDRTFALSLDPPVHFSRPAIDVLFESAADVYGTGLLGVVLSGANSDGAAGLAAVVRAGGAAIVQSPETASSPEMPRAAVKAAGGPLVLAPQAVAGFLRGVPPRTRPGGPERR